LNLLSDSCDFTVVFVEGTGSGAGLKAKMEEIRSMKLL